MSNGEVRPPAIQDLGLVHNLIEQCLQLHMRKREAVNLILREGNIDPTFTELVWEQLEQENREFFEAYYIRLALRQQVQQFNDLLGQQATLMGQITNGAVPSPGSNGSHISGSGSQISGNGSMQVNGYHMPENISIGPANASNGTVNGFYRPLNGSNGPVNGFHRPVNESNSSANASNGPVNGSHRLANGSNGLANASNGPVNASYRQVNGSHRPANASHGRENGSNMQSFAQNGGCCSTDEAGPSIRSQNLHPTISSNIPSAFINGMSMLQLPTPFDFSTSSRGTEFLNNPLHIQRSTMGSLPFSGMEMSSQNGSMLATNDSSFGQILHDLSLPHMSTPYPNVLASNAYSEFATSDVDCFNSYEDLTSD